MSQEYNIYYNSTSSSRNRFKFTQNTYIEYSVPSQAAAAHLPRLLLSAAPISSISFSFVLQLADMGYK